MVPRRVVLCYAIIGLKSSSRFERSSGNFVAGIFRSTKFPRTRFPCAAASSPRSIELSPLISDSERTARVDVSRETCYSNEIYPSISQMNPSVSRTPGSEGRGKGSSGFRWRNEVTFGFNFAKVSIIPGESGVAAEFDRGSTASTAADPANPRNHRLPFRAPTPSPAAVAAAIYRASLGKRDLTETLLQFGWERNDGISRPRYVVAGNTSFPSFSLSLARSLSLPFLFSSHGYFHPSGLASHGLRYGGSVESEY